MLLTSLNRVKNALGITTTDSDGNLSRLIASSSKRIEYFLKRENAIQLTTYTEYFNPYKGQSIFRLKAYPVSSIASVYTDSTGLYTGSQALVPSTDYVVGVDGKTLQFTTGSWVNNPFLYPFNGGVYPKSLRVIYIGGLAADPVVSSWTKSADTGGTLAVGNYVLGAISGAVSKITAQAAGTISYESIYGLPVATETITEYDSLDNSLSGGLGVSNPTGVTATLTASTSLSLCESYPDLSMACELYVRYLFKNIDQFGNITVSRDGETRSSRSDNTSNSSLTPEVRELCEAYVNRYQG
jgi:hypothetical protein